MRRPCQRHRVSMLRRRRERREAHEAIRPAGDHFRTPQQVENQLRGREFQLYERIWKRTIASQMADATGSTASVRLVADIQVAGASQEATLAASGTIITFRGFLAAYEEGQTRVTRMSPSPAARSCGRRTRG